MALSAQVKLIWLPLTATAVRVDGEAGGAGGGGEPDGLRASTVTEYGAKLCTKCVLALAIAGQ